MMSYIVRTLDGEKYWVSDAGIVELDYDKRIGSIRSVNDALSEAIKESEQLENDISEELQKIKRYLKSSNRSLGDIYAYFENLYLTTRFEDVKILSRRILEMIEALSKLDELSVFTRDKRIKFIKNLKKILSELGYDVTVEDYGHGTPIIVAVKGNDDKLIIKLDAKAYGYIETTSVLRELYEDDEIVELLSEDKKRSIVRKLKRLSV